MGVNLSYGNQRAHSEQKVVQQTHAGSQLTAGRDLRLQATQGDIEIAGSQLKAGRDTTLSAAQDILLHSSQDSETLSGNNSSHGGSLGVGIGASGNSAGISISASVNASKGKENGSSLTHQETTLDSGSQVTIHSGRDTTLTGAQVNGERIVAEVGRNLTLTSEQDSNRYDSKQQSASAGGSFTFGTMTPSGSLNLSKDKMHSTYDSVQEQTGLFAGKGGFDVKVGEHTQLNGAVIGSTASAEHNRLETGTLGFSDIDNQAGYKVEHQSVGASTGGGMANFIGNLANGLAVAGNKEKSDSSTTHAAVSEGTIVINDTAKQQQNVDDLSRDVEHAHQTLSPIFDKEKEQQRMQTLQLIGEVGNQAADIARTQGEIAGLKAQSDPAALHAARALGWLNRYLQQVRPDNLALPDCRAMFLAMDGLAGLTANGITLAVVPCLSAAGMEKGSCQLFRHATATQRLENGADLRWIQAILGHRSDLYAGEHPCAADGAWKYASGGADRQITHEIDKR